MTGTTDSASQLVTRREAESLLGYAPGSLKVVMREQRGRWPAPIACRLPRRSLLWDLDALRAAAGRSGKHLRGPSAAGDDGLVTCLSCDRRYRNLGPHLARSHDMTADDYRAEHRLPATTALMATETRAILAEARAEAMAEDPSIVERMQAATPPLDELAARSTDARAGTDDLPAVRAARRGAALRTLPAAQRARREQLEDRARAAGYRSMAAAIKATRDMSSRAAAERIGVGASTVKRWRRKQEGKQ